MKITLSVIKADIGGFPGHRSVHPDLIDIAEKELKKAKKKRLLKDFKVLACGDDLQLIMTHKKGVDNEKIHELAWNTFQKGTKKAKSLKLYGAGQDLLAETFSGNVKGAGPGVAELEMEERKSEPIVVFMADKTEPGAWNYPLYKMFADPFNTAGLVIDPAMNDGFVFEVHDLYGKKKIDMKTPEESYSLLSFIGSPSRYVIKHIKTRDGEIVASCSTQRLSLMAGRYVGKDDPVMIVRAQHGLPALGEILEPFTFPYMAAGWMRGSHNGPVMPCAFDRAHPSRFDGPPRVIAAGFQLAKGKLNGPVDLFDDPSFDKARSMANDLADYLMRQGPFEPHRLPHEELEYTSMPSIKEKFEKRFKKL